MLETRSRRGTGGRASGDGRAAQSYGNTSDSDRQPIALAVRKPGRGSGGDGWPVVGKVTTFCHSDEPVLAVAWQTQQGTSKAISLPECVLDYAEGAGATDFYLQDRRRRKMWTCPLATFHRGKLQPDQERYIPLAWLSPTPYRDWEYAEPVLRLTPAPTPRRGPAEPMARQLGLFEVQR